MNDVGPFAKTARLDFKLIFNADLTDEADNDGSAILFSFQIR